MWVKILKYAGKAALALGLHDKAINWVRRKLAKAETAAIEKMDTVQNDIDELEDEVHVKIENPVKWSDLEG